MTFITLVITVINIKVYQITFILLPNRCHTFSYFHTIFLEDKWIPIHVCRKPNQETANRLEPVHKRKGLMTILPKRLSMTHVVDHVIVNVPHTRSKLPCFSFLLRFTHFSFHQWVAIQLSTTLTPIWWTLLIGIKLQRCLYFNFKEWILGGCERILRGLYMFFF